VLEKPAVKNELGVLGRLELAFPWCPDGGVARYVGCPVPDVLAEYSEFLWLLPFLPAEGHRRVSEWRDTQK